MSIICRPKLLRLFNADIFCFMCLSDLNNSKKFLVILLRKLNVFDYFIIAKYCMGITTKFAKLIGVHEVKKVSLKLNFSKYNVNGDILQMVLLLAPYNI